MKNRKKPAKSKSHGKPGRLKISTKTWSTAAQIREARKLLDEEKYDKAFSVALPLWGKISARDEKHYLELCRLLALAAANLNQLDEAETYARAGLREKQNSLDFIFVLAIVAAMRTDYDEAIRLSERYESLLKGDKPIDAAERRWDQSLSLRHQLLNAFAVALNERDQSEKAEEVLKEALAMKPDYDSTYINLNLVYKSQGRESEAEEILQQGRQILNAGASRGKNQEPDKPGPTISVCMIVKNEELLLPRCLESIKNIADEIILVDTGSEDRTLEIAEEFGCKIYHYPWQGDFSSARNESLKYATKDWIFIIDADEELPAGEDQKIRYFIDKPDIDIISMSVYSKSLETGGVSSFLPSVRLYRQKLGLRFEGIVHNRLNIKPGTGVSRCNIKLYHYGYDLPREKLEKKLARSRELLERQIEENPDDLFAHFNMAQLLRGTKDAFTEETNRKISFHAQKVIDHPEAPTDKYYGQYVMAHHQAALAFFNLKDFEKCKEYCLKALELKADYIDPHLTLGNTFCALNQLEQAKKYYHLYLDNLKTYNPEIETHNIIMIYMENQHIAWYGLGVMAQSENNIDEAIDFFTRANKTRENYLDSLLRLGRLYLDKNLPGGAREKFKQYLDGNETSAEACFGIGDALSRQGDETQAVEWFDRAVGLDPINLHMRFRLGRTLIKTGRQNDGVEQLRKAADSAGEQFSVIMEAADILFGLAEFHQAAEYYSLVLEIKPDHSDALNNLANCYYKSGDLNRAAETYQRIIDKYPGYLLAYRNLGFTCFKLGDNEKALEYLHIYSSKKPDDLSVQRLMGDIHLQMAEYDKAVLVYEQYLNSNGKDVTGWLNLSDAYLQLGYGDAAILGYQKALDLDPENKAARDRVRYLAEVAEMA